RARAPDQARRTDQEPPGRRSGAGHWLVGAAHPVAHPGDSAGNRQEDPARDKGWRLQEGAGLDPRRRAAGDLAIERRIAGGDCLPAWPGLRRGTPVRQLSRVMSPRYAITLLVLVALGCMPPDEVAEPSSPTVVAPHLRIGLFSAISRPQFESSFGLAVRDPDEGVHWTVPVGEILTAELRGDLVRVSSGGQAASRRQLELVPLDSTGTVLVNDKAYRGRIRIAPGLDGLRVINVIDLESYLVSVVGAEMGRRLPEELAALEAQAVAARTYTLRNLERNSAQGYDLAADVSSQVYGGVATEMPLAQLAVDRTRGQILTLDGIPIDAFYSSTCGGHTESSGAVFSGGDRSYLPAQPDVDPSGRAWCAISPAYQWRETWNGAEVAATLRRTLAAE